MNDELDPNAQMTVWLSSAENHQWNPSQKTPATAWEAEIDKLMRAQASTLDPKKRKEDFDKVQEIAWQAGAVHLSGEQERAVGGVAGGAQRASGSAEAAGLLEH